MLVRPPFHTLNTCLCWQGPPCHTLPNNVFPACRGCGPQHRNTDFRRRHGHPLTNGTFPLIYRDGRQATTVVVVLCGTLGLLQCSYNRTCVTAVLVCTTMMLILCVLLLHIDVRTSCARSFPYPMYPVSRNSSRTQRRRQRLHVRAVGRDCKCRGRDFRAWERESVVVVLLSYIYTATRTCN